MAGGLIPGSLLRLFEERFFGFQPQNDIGLSWFDFPHHDLEFCRTGHAEPREASPFGYPAACCGVVHWLVKKPLFLLDKGFLFTI